MTYIVIDLEWNQARSNRDVVSDNEGNKLYGEIIQVGAIKLDENLNIKDEFKINICPKYYKLIHRKVRQITGIEQEDLKKGEEFRHAMEKFKAWCGENFTFLTWGPDDIRMLRRNIEIYGDDSSWVNCWFNVQSIYNLQTNSGENQKSLQTAMEYFGIIPEVPLHDALNDAYYTALVVGKLDLVQGIADMIHADRLCAILDESKPLMCEVYSGYKTRREIFRDSNVITIRCPECQDICENIRKWVPERNDRYITLASCSRHKKYIARMTMNKDKDIYNVTKVIYAAGGGAEAFYKKRAQKEESPKKRHKKKVKSVSPRKKNMQLEKVK